MKTDSDFPHILCVNPWIHDFAAYDFWARPLGLLSLASLLRDAGIHVSYLDCLDRFHPNQTPKLKVLWDGRGPYRKKEIAKPEGLKGINRRFSRYGIDPKWFIKDLKQIEKPDLILVTSLMTYWASGVAETISVIRAVWPGIPVVLGGIYASLCRSHAQQHSGADEVVAFSGENRLAGLILKYTGYNAKINVDEQNLDSLPYPAFDLQRRIPYVPILTSRGCPFACEYCASSFLEKKFRQRSADHVFDEIMHWHYRYQVLDFAFYDDALLVKSKEHAIPLFEKIIASGIQLRFHTPNALHVREISSDVSRLMFQAGFKTIRLGLETTDFSKHRPHDIKVRAHEFESAVTQLKAAGFSEKQIGAYLLCGLPGQSLDQVAVSMDMVRRHGILPVLAYYTPIPHTKMWPSAVAASKFDLESDPLCTNNSLFPCMNSKADIQRISQLKNK